MSYHDSRCPAKPGIVSPMGRLTCERPNGLQQSQSNAARFKRGDLLHGFRAGGPYKATNGCFARTVKTTPPTCRERTPGRKGPSAAVKPKQNTVFRGKKIGRPMLERQTEHELTEGLKVRLVRLYLLAYGDKVLASVKLRNAPIYQRLKMQTWKVRPDLRRWISDMEESMDKGRIPQAGLKPGHAEVIRINEERRKRNAVKVEHAAIPNAKTLPCFI